MPYIRDSFLAGRSFSSLEEMNQLAGKWCLSVAGERLHGTTRQRPLDLFQRLEAPALRPLPAQPFEAVPWTQAKVARDCHVQVLARSTRCPIAPLGQTHPLETQYVFEICRVPASLQPLAMRADSGGLLLEEVDSDVAQSGKVLSAMSFAHTAFIFTKADVEHPMKAVLDAPVRPNVPQHRRRIAS